LYFFVFAFILAPGGQGLAGGFIDPVEAGVVAIEVGEGAGFVAEGAEGEGEFEFLPDAGFLAGDFGIVEVDFEGPEAVQAPAGGGEQVDECELEGGFGLEFGEVEFAKGTEFVRRLVREDDLAGGEAVGERRGLAAGESFGGLGSAGAGAVGARGIDAALRGHGAEVYLG
jgi:hypothetical protein